MSLRKSTIEKQNKLQEIPEEELNRMRDILNEYIVKNRKKHLFMLRKALLKRLGSMLTDEILEDILQEQYVYAWINITRVMEFYETGYLDRYFNTLFYNPATSKNARIRLGRDIHTEIVSDCHPYEESPEQYTNYALNAKLPLEERIEAHNIAVDETKQYLLDNPQSNLNKALKEIKYEIGPNAYRVALNYIATPSYTFLANNKKTFGIHNIQHSIDAFKKICSKIYGKEICKQAEMPWVKFK